MHPIYWLLFVFFQAEDGIRDLTVTGVQTCALPILSRKADWRQSPPACRQSALRDTRGYDWALQSTWRRSCGAEISWRSEERRVGKEGRCGLVAVAKKQKMNLLIDSGINCRTCRTCQ